MSETTIPSDIPADSLKEKISSMVDDELNGQECSQVIMEVTADNASVMSSWEQYHMIGEAMRKNLPDVLYADLSNNISKAIASEPVYHNSLAAQDVADSKATVTNIAPKPTNTKNPVWGYAIAASISAFAIAGLFQLNQVDQFAQPIGQTVASKQQPLVQQPPALNDIEWRQEVDQEPVLVQNRYPLSRIPDEQLHRYIVNHNEHSMAMPTQRAMIPYARLVGYEGAQ